MEPLTSSVIVPTCNRADSLRRTLDSLAQQVRLAGRFETIVVDDGSTDETPSIANEFYPFDLRYVRQPNKGAAAARNRGAEEARGRVLIFLDDDIIVVPRFVSHMAEAADQESVVVVGNLYPAIRPDATVFERVRASEMMIPPATNALVEISFTACLSGIFSVQRNAFFEIGGMQDVAGDGRVAWGDVDFGYRAWRQGYRFWRCNGAAGYHHDLAARDLPTCALRWERAAESAVVLFRKYPDLVTYLAMFRDKTPLSIRDDLPGLMFRKVARALTAYSPVLWGMKCLSTLLELTAPNSVLLRLLYRWIISSHIYRGFRLGLDKYGSVTEAI